MKCRNCPYGQEDFYRRMAWYNKIISKCGIPNDFYGDLQPDEAADELEQFVWCDKVGGTCIAITILKQNTESD